MNRSELGYKGFKDYKPRFLKIYDWWVLSFMASRVWKVGAEPALDLYRHHMGRRHLDVGPGTGYFIARSDPPRELEVTLVDANPHVLVHCGRTLAHLRPRLVEANVLRPLPLEGPFDSAALAHVLHCLPGPSAAKGVAVEHIATKLTADGVLFGGTVLGIGANHTRPARLAVRALNHIGGFDNRDDDVAGLCAILQASFYEVDVDDSRGSIAYFVASRPRRSKHVGS